VGQCASQLDARVPRQVCFTGGFDVAVSLVAMSSHTPSSLQAKVCVHVDRLGPTGRRAALALVRSCFSSRQTLYNRNTLSTTYPTLLCTLL
jgi:hypothetical protein